MLVAVTIVSVLAAVAFGWLAWRVRREERRRSEARVAALSAAIDGPDERSAPAYAQPDAPVVMNSMFAPEHAHAAKGAPIVKLAVAVAMSIALLIVIAMSNRGTADVGEADRAAAAPISTARASAPLELLSMRHQRDGQTLKVSGLVRNPRAGSRLSRVTAVIFAFNRAGAYIGSGSAGVDFTTLEPGDESPFVVTVSGIADVGRYRVSFRTDNGAVRHVDRRAEQMRLAARVE